MNTQLTKEQIHRLPVNKSNITLADGTIQRQGKVQKTAAQLASEWATETDIALSAEDTDDDMLFAVKR